MAAASRRKPALALRPVCESPARRRPRRLRHAGQDRLTAVRPRPVAVKRSRASPSLTVAGLSRLTGLASGRARPNSLWPQRPEQRKKALDGRPTPSTNGHSLVAPSLVLRFGQGPRRPTPRPIKAVRPARVWPKVGADGGFEGRPLRAKPDLTLSTQFERRSLVAPNKALPAVRRRLESAEQLQAGPSSESGAEGARTRFVSRPLAGRTSFTDAENKKTGSRRRFGCGRPPADPLVASQSVARPRTADSPSRRLTLGAVRRSPSPAVGASRLGGPRRPVGPRDSLQSKLVSPAAGALA